MRLEIASRSSGVFSGRLRLAGVRLGAACAATAVGAGLVVRRCRGFGAAAAAAAAARARRGLAGGVLPGKPLTACWRTSISARSLSSRPSISACLLAIVSATASLIFWKMSFIRRSVTSRQTQCQTCLSVAFAHRSRKPSRPGPGAVAVVGVVDEYRVGSPFCLCLRLRL